MPATARVCTTVEISWDGTGDFTGPYDNVTADTAGDPGIAVEMGKDGSRALSPPKVTSADFELLNHTAKYSGQNSRSPLYQQVLPGRPVKIDAAVGDVENYRDALVYRDDEYYRGVAVYAVIATRIDDISQTARLGNQRVRLTTMSDLGPLVTTNVTVGVMTAIRTDQAITALLDAAGWPSAQRAISLGDTTLLLWWCDDKPAWTAALEVLAAEGPGALYLDSAGVVHFENRNYRGTAGRATAAQAVYFDQSLISLNEPYRDAVVYRDEVYYRGATSGLYFTDLTFEPGYRGVFNRATYATTRRQLQALATQIWQYGAVVSLAAGQSLTLIAHPTDPFMGAITPVEGTDYTVAPAGGVTVSLSAPSGLVAFITLTAGGAGASVTGVGTNQGIQLRARTYAKLSDTTIQNGLDASASIADFGQQTYQVAGWPEIDPNQATAVCDAWVSRYSVPRPTVDVTLENVDSATVREILSRTVSDRVTLVEQNSGLNGDFWIESKSLTIAGAGGRHLTAVLHAEQCEEIRGDVWDGSASHWGSGPTDSSGAHWGR